MTLAGSLCASSTLGAGFGLTVASLNLAREADWRRIAGELGKSPAIRNADVLLFQEAVHTTAAHDGVAGSLARAWKLRVAFAPAGPAVYDRGLAILSRFPIRDIHVRALKPFNLRFHSRSRFALAATVETPAGPVHIWNVHLDTRINAADRLAQLDPVLGEAAAVRGAKIIGGDFNTNDFYWFGNVLPVPLVERQTEAVRRSMSGHGFRTPLSSGSATFDHLGMHLDWIYASGLTPESASIEPVWFSDHRAVVARFASSD